MQEGAKLEKKKKKKVDFQNKKVVKTSSSTGCFKHIRQCASVLCALDATGLCCQTVLEVFVQDIMYKNFYFPES